VGPSDRTGDKGHKLKHRRFPLNIRKHFFTAESGRVLAQAAQRGCGVSHELGILNSHLDMVLGSQL